jgi:photosystem II stability/assembly factor-like uncharacterized protein
MPLSSDLLRRASGLAAALCGSVSVVGLWPLGGADLQYGTWHLVFDRPSTLKYEDFSFPTASDGWVVSAHGDIYYTDNGGAHWTLQASGLGRLRSIDFVDRKRGFAGTVDGRLYRTLDSGITWTDISSTLPRQLLGICGITHVNDRIHLVGRYSGGAADHFISPDGGWTWRPSSLSDLAYGLVDILFLTESTGLIGGIGLAQAPGQGPAVILKSSDRGNTWRPVFRQDGGRGFAWKLFAHSDTLIFAALQSQDGTLRVAKSVDSGDTWAEQIVATGTPQVPGIQSIGFIDEETGWVGGFFSGMYESSDGGMSWRQLAMPNDRLINRFERVGDVLFTASTRGILRYARQ